MGRRIGLDSDGVIYNFDKKYQECLRKNGFCVPDGWSPSQWDSYQLDLGLSREEFEEYMHLGVDGRMLFWEGEILDDADFWIPKLRAAGNEIHIVTHRFSGRKESSLDATVHWYEMMGIEYDSLTVTRTANKTIVPTDVFLEDNKNNYDQLEAAGVEAYLVNRPWNLENDNRRRVDTFGEFAQLWL